VDFKKIVNEYKLDFDLEKLLEISRKSSEIGGQILKNNYRNIQNISSKGRKGDLVTNVDLEAEEKIKEFLNNETPEIKIIAEESKKSKESKESKDLKWCIDPLDGTTNFTHGYPFFGTSVGLVFNDIPILGSISVPYLNEDYWACIGKGAFCNNEKLKVSSPQNLSESLLVTGFAYDRFDKIDNNYAEFCYLTHKTRGVRRGGAAAVDLAFVASGKVDGFWERGLEIWDIAAGAIIVKEAGGIVSNYPEGKLKLNTGKILACSPSIEIELKKELSQVTPLNNKFYT